MKTLKFKTNIKCTGCISKVAPALDNEKSIEKWEVDIYKPEKYLTVETENEDSERIVSIVKEAGFQIEETTV